MWTYVNQNFFLKNLIDLNVKRNERKLRLAGFTPLLRSANIGNEKIARILIEKGANVNARNDDGDSALSLAAKKGKNQFLEHKVVQFLRIKTKRKRITN